MKRKQLSKHRNHQSSSCVPGARTSQAALRHSGSPSLSVSHSHCLSTRKNKGLCLRELFKLLSHMEHLIVPRVGVQLHTQRGFFPLQEKNIKIKKQFGLLIISCISPVIANYQKVCVCVCVQKFFFSSFIFSCFFILKQRQVYNISLCHLLRCCCSGAPGPIQGSLAHSGRILWLEKPHMYNQYFTV